MIFQIFPGRLTMGDITYKPAIIDARTTLGFPPVRAQKVNSPKMITTRFQPHGIRIIEAKIVKIIRIYPTCSPDTAKTWITPVLAKSNFIFSSIVDLSPKSNAVSNPAVLGSVASFKEFLTKACIERIQLIIKGKLP